MKVINKNPDRNGCISEKMLLDYAHGALSAKEQHFVERHLLDCELCSDALEGVLLLKNKDKSTEVVNQIKHEINQRIIQEKKRKAISFHWWQIAAILLIILISAGSYLIIQRASEKNENTISQNQSTINNFPEKKNIEPHNQAAVKDETQAAKSEASEKVATSKTESQNEIMASDEPSITQPGAAEASVYEAKEVYDGANLQKAKSSRAMENEEPPIREVAASSDNSKKDVPHVTEAVDLNEISNSKSFKKLPSANQNSNIDRNLNEGLKFYNEKNYAKALTYFRKSSQDLKIDFYSGVCHYQLKNFLQCISFIDKSIINTNVAYYSEALWYKANALVELKEIDKAKSVLNQIILIDSPFKSKAQNLLDRL